jgi:hypothetical protein
MKAEADQGVVDARLNVYGVTNLKVADMSIAPLNVGSVSVQQGIKSMMLIVHLEHIFDGAPDWREGCNDHRRRLGY